MRYKLWTIFFLIFIPQVVFAVEQSATKSLAFFVGHSQWAKGSYGNGIPPEWDYCRFVGEQVMQLAPQYNITTKIFFRGKGAYDQAVGHMHKEKNAWDPNAPVISCHYNATPITVDNSPVNSPQLRALFANGKAPKKGSLTGTLILYNNNPNSPQIAQRLLKNVQMIMPHPASNFQNVSQIILLNKVDRGAMEVLGNDKVPVMILEIGYGDNPIDYTIMRDPIFKNKLAKAILKTFSTNDKDGT